MLVMVLIWDGRRDCMDDMSGLGAGCGEMVLQYYILLNVYFAAGIEESNVRPLSAIDVLKKI